MAKAANLRAELQTKTIEIYFSQGLEPALARVKRGLAREPVESLRRVAEEMVAEEHALLRERSASAEEGAQSSIAWGTIIAILVGIGLALLWKNVSRLSLARQQALKLLADSEESLRLATRGGGIGI